MLRVFRLPLVVLALAPGLALAAPGSLAAQAAAREADPRLTGRNGDVMQESQEAGFEILFDGTSLDRWRGFRRDDVPGGWSIRDGTLAFTPGGGSGDIITRDTYTDFDLRLEWKIGPGGNSGIFFGVVEDAPRTYEAGPEMQILDNAGHVDGGNTLTSAGANYALHAPSADVTKPVGEWNEVRIVRHENRVTHWLNGTKIVEYDLGTPEWEALVAGSKFAEWPGYGTHEEGHIGLQDHGDPVWFRHIRIRRLP